MATWPQRAFGGKWWLWAGCSVAAVAVLGAASGWANSARLQQVRDTGVVAFTCRTRNHAF